MPRSAASLVFVCSFALAVVALLAGCSSGTPRLEIKDIFGETSPSIRGMGSIYMRIANDGDGADRLTAVRSETKDIAAELHGEKNGRMVKTDAIKIAAGKVTALTAGDRHIMVFGIPKDLPSGYELPLVLVFDGSGEKKIIARFQRP